MFYAMINDNFASHNIITENSIAKHTDHQSKVHTDKANHIYQTNKVNKIRRNNKKCKGA